MVKENTLNHNLLKQISYLVAAVALVVLTNGALAAVAQATNCDGSSSCQDNSNFRVEITEVLTVSVTTPDTWAHGLSTANGTFLRNTIGLNIDSNNEGGFTTSMAAKTATTALTNKDNSNYTIPTFTDSNGHVRGTSFQANFWGWSTNDGSDTGTYYAVLPSTGTPSILSDLSRNSAGNKTGNLYLGANANTSTPSGTYANTIVISVVGGVINESTNPITPTNPVTPTNPGTTTPTYVADVTNPSAPGYDATAGYTAYTTTATDTTTTPNTTTITTNINSGDTRSAYAAPHGVSSSSPAAEESSPVPIILAVVGGVAATSGVGVAAYSLVKNRKFTVGGGA